MMLRLAVASLYTFNILDAATAWLGLIFACGDVTGIRSNSLS